jgi:hypothetical protein
MPPRYAYWTILIDGKATAFRAREREELLPTFNQLARKNSDIVMRYFSRGRLWDSPEQAQWAGRNPSEPRAESRGRDWRPGGQHRDPRARQPAGEGRAGKAGGGKAGWAGRAGAAGKAGWAGKAAGAGRTGWAGKPAGAEKAGEAGRGGAAGRGGWAGKPGGTGKAGWAKKAGGAGQAGSGGKAGWREKPGREERPDRPRPFGTGGRRPPRKPR